MRQIVSVKFGIANIQVKHCNVGLVGGCDTCMSCTYLSFGIIHIKDQGGKTWQTYISGYRVQYLH